MFHKIQFPTDFHDSAMLADWLEITAFVSDDGETSAGDLERQLSRLNCARPEEAAGNALAEVDRRGKAAATAYPFQRSPSGSAVIRRDEAATCIAYLFCLLLSFCRWKLRKGAGLNPWLLFEELSCHAARNYLGEAVAFGTSTRVGKTAGTVFASRVNMLCKQLGEGDEFNGGKTFNAQDEKLDLVAWRPFADGRASKVVMFGQCASGANWRTKLPEIQPKAFWDNWIAGPAVSPLFRCFFMPHRIFFPEEWAQKARKGGVLFDRCRIAFHSHEQIADTELAQRLSACCKKEWGIKLA